MKLNLHPFEFGKEPEIDYSLKNLKYITLEGKQIPVTKENIHEIARAYFKEKEEEITQEKIDEFIKNF